MDNTMDVDSDLVLGWARLGVLIICMGWAAWFDHNERRVSNEHWIVWTKPVIFIWSLDLLIQGAHWSIWLTASAIIAYASGSVIGRPTLKEARAGNRIDQLVLGWYLLSIIGLVAGAVQFSSSHPLDVLLGDVTGDAALWWAYIGALFVLFVIDLGWRMRFIHGGADAKALMWVTLLFPSWGELPIHSDVYMDEVILHLPPSLSLLIWGGLFFLFIPFILLIRNIASGNIRSFSDLSMAWIALSVPLSTVQNRHAWLLTDTMELPNGDLKIYHRRRAPRQSPSDDEVESHVEKLKIEGVENVWVSLKLPLLLFLWPAILPLWLFGDPMALVIPVLLP